MPGPNYHARTHLHGGTDPLPINLPMAILSNDGIGDQLIDTAAQELIWGTSSQHSSTNAPDVFRFDPADPAGLLIYQPGYYLCHAVVHNSGGSNFVPRTIYQAAQPLSSGAGAGFGNELGFPYGFSLGTGSGNEGIGNADGTTSKSELAHLALTRMGDKDNPSRYVVVCAQGPGSADWTVSSSQGATAVVVKVADYFYGTFPAPDA